MCLRCGIACDKIGTWGAFGRPEPVWGNEESLSNPVAPPGDIIPAWGCDLWESPQPSSYILELSCKFDSALQNQKGTSLAANMNVTITANVRCKSPSPDISDETIHSLNEGFLKFCKDGGHTFNKKTDMIGPPMSKEQMPTPDKETQMPRPEVEKRRQGNEALKDVIEEPEMQPEKKRKRGRPRKSDSTKSKESEKSGRPAKRVETASGSGGSKDSKNTGQPSKQVEAATGPPKKKRGRPPKDKSKVAGQAGAMAGSSTQGDKLTPPSTNESGSSGNPTSSESISPSSNPQSSAYPTPPKDSPE